MCDLGQGACFCETHFVTYEMGTMISPSEDGVHVVTGKHLISRS